MPRPTARRVMRTCSAGRRTMRRRRPGDRRRERRGGVVGRFGALDAQRLGLALARFGFAAAEREGNVALRGIAQCEIVHPLRVVCGLDVLISAGWLGRPDRQIDDPRAGACGRAGRVGATQRPIGASIARNGRCARNVDVRGRRSVGDGEVEVAVGNVVRFAFTMWQCQSGSGVDAAFFMTGVVVDGLRAHRQRPCRRRSNVDRRRHGSARRKRR